METFDSDKLVKYEIDDQKLYVGFPTFQAAEEYAAQNLGELVEVAFTDGNDNPRVTNEVGLVNRKLHFNVQAGPEYRFIHSSDPDFKDYADHLQEIQSDLREKSPEEIYITDAEPQMTEDPIIVLKNDQFESITSRERSKYLKHANVYEIGVLRDSNH